MLYLQKNIMALEIATSSFGVKISVDIMSLIVNMNMESNKR